MSVSHFLGIDARSNGERVRDKSGESEFHLHAPHLSRRALNGIEGFATTRGACVAVHCETGEIKKTRKKEESARKISERRTLAERMITNERSSF